MGAATPVPTAVPGRPLREDTPFPPSPAVQPRIGPNALLRTLQALAELEGREAEDRVAARAALPATPEGLVDEAHFVRLARLLRQELPPGRAEAVLERAGRLTALYVLAHRIPPWARRLLPFLPSAVGLPLVLEAFRRNAWTFAGSGVYGWSSGSPPCIRLEGSPTCRDVRATHPSGGFYRAAFEVLLQALVDPRIRVREVECLAEGGKVCRFAIHRPGRVPAADPIQPCPSESEPCASS